MTIDEAISKSTTFKLTIMIVGAVLLISVLGILALAVLRDPIPPELTATAASSFAFLTGSTVTAGQLKQ